MVLAKVMVLVSTSDRESSTRIFSLFIRVINVSGVSSIILIWSAFKTNSFPELKRWSVINSEGLECLDQKILRGSFPCPAVIFEEKVHLSSCITTL